MTTDSKKNKAEEYLKNLSKEKYETKAKRMIKTTLEDGTVIIGKNYYDKLRNIPDDFLKDNQKLKIKNFEDYHGITKADEKSKIRKKELEESERKIENRKKKAISNINHDSVLEVFKKYYKIVNNKEFIFTSEAHQNILPLIHYFAREEDAFLKFGAKDEKGKFLSNPSLEKGICIIGGFGNGKTSVMKTFHRMFTGLEGFSFGRYSSHEIILEYENASRHNHPEILENLWSKLTRSTLYIDDLKAEPQAFAFGKKNLMNTLILERYNKNLKTHFSCNYATGHNNDIKKALIELKTKYSNQVYDRIFEMCNIIEFKGKSFRK